MKITRNSIKACCGGTSLLIRVDKMLDKTFIDFMSNFGFIEQEHFTKSGIIYIENSKLVLQGPLYNTKLTITCKTNKTECIEYLDEIEKELINF